MENITCHEDQNGNILKEGDTVLIPAIVVSLRPVPYYSNATIKLIEPLFPTSRLTTLELNTRQCRLDKNIVSLVEETNDDINNDNDTDTYTDTNIENEI